MAMMTSIETRNKPGLKERLLRIWEKSSASISALGLALIFSTIAILLLGKNPLEAFRSILEGGFGSRYALTEVLVKSSPLILAALGTAIAFRCKMWNIGVEGQLVIGGAAASTVALAFPDLPAFLLLLLAFLASFLAGGFWAGIAGFLKARYNASEIINTIMLNYVAIYLVEVLVRGPLKDAQGYVPQSARFAPQAWLPILVENTRLHAGFILALIAIGAGAFFLTRTVLGFSIIAVGSNPKAAEASGISIERHMVLAMFISGGLAGLAGAGEVLGLHHKLLDGFSAGYGFSAMAAAILGGLNPVGVGIFSFFFAALRVGADHMQRQIGVPIALVYLIEGTVIIFLQGREMLPMVFSGLRKKVLQIQHTEQVT
jgi:general nucleoside transport system permease protein